MLEEVESDKASSPEAA